MTKHLHQTYASTQRLLEVALGGSTNEFNVDNDTLYWEALESVIDDCTFEKWMVSLYRKVAA